MDSTEFSTLCSLPNVLAEPILLIPLHGIQDVEPKEPQEPDETCSGLNPNA